MSHANGSAFGAAGALVSTSHDLAKWARMLFNGEILPVTQLMEMQSIVNEDGQPIPATNNDSPTGYGLGIAQLYTDPEYGTFWWHNGGGFGYHSIFIWSLKTNVVITMVTNEQDKDIQPNNPVIIEIPDLLNQQKLKQINGG